MEDISGSLIDVTGLSLADLAALPETALTAALHEVLSTSAAVTSAGFSSRLGSSHRANRAVTDLNLPSD
jgi:FXSXX-COOH protein